MTNQIIIETVAKHFQLEPDEILSRKQTGTVPLSRGIVFILLKERKVPVQAIADLFNKDYNTIVNGIKSARNRIETETKIRAKVEQIRNEVSLVSAT